MRTIREILRLRFDRRASIREIALSCKLARSTVADYVARATVAKLGWPLPAELDDDAALNRLLFPNEHRPVSQRPEPDWPSVHRELKRPHVTRMLVWQEYREHESEGYHYSQFCDRYARWAESLPVTMRQEHRAGEKLFVDFSGDGSAIVDARTGEERIAKLFVAVLGASNYTYVEAVLREDLPTWIGCHVRAFAFLGGVPEAVVPDNLKSGVTRPNAYDPELNPTYADLVRHYGIVVLPARPRRPRDKAKVEQGVLLAERWIIAVLRNRTFHSLTDLNEAIAPLLDRLNARPMRKLKASRRDLFDALDRPALGPLPESAYALAVWKRPKVNIDYHVDFDGHSYSVPYQLRGQTLDLRATETVVEIFHAGQRIASHVRSHVKHKPTTDPGHMPAAHRAHAEWTPSRLIAWAEKVGPKTAELVAAIMESRPHPEHGYRACLGVMRLRKRFPDERIERVCTRALALRAASYRSVESILKHNLDREEDPDARRHAAAPAAPERPRPRLLPLSWLSRRRPYRSRRGGDVHQRGPAPHEEMLIEQTLDRLTALQLHGMVEALRQWLERPADQQLQPTDLVGLIADAEWSYRENRTLTTRLRQARFRQTACIEDIDYRHPCGLSKPLILELATSRGVAQHQAVILIGPTGLGRSYLACALGQKACRDGYVVIYRRTSRLFDELA